MSTGFTGECITFLDSNKFEYKFFSCTGGKIGKGNYKLNRKDLVLNFENDTIGLRKRIKVDTSNSLSDSVLMSFNLFNYELNKKLAFVNITFLTKKGLIKGFTTNLEGKCEVLMEKSKEEINLKFSVLGYEILYIPVVIDKNYDFNIKLKYRSETYYNGSIKKYKIKRKRKKVITLKAENNWSVWTKYTKTKTKI